LYVSAKLGWKGPTVGLLLPIQPTKVKHAKKMKLVLSFSEMIRWFPVILLCDIYCYKVGI
jgi:hypothetical protein